MKALETLFNIIMLPVYLAAIVWDILKECWWLVLILVILVGPRFAARVE